MKHKSYLTAITRKVLPAPTRWLIKAELIEGKVMDYGCGKCGSVNPPEWFNYDPYYQPNANFGNDRFDTILCNYVLCTLPKMERIGVLEHIQVLLRINGMAYVTVRNDKPKQGWGLSSKQTYQGRCEHVTDDLVYKNSQFRIYRLTKKTRLV